jgi:peroxiredoxin Q/BCP
MLTPNTKAPTFSLLDQDSAVHTLEQYAGKMVLLYFYPKDDTPGCTKEACTIAEMYNDFEKSGIVVLGVSADSSESHTKFKQKYHLPFTLLSDPEKTMIDAYGAKNMIGMTKRISYLIGPDGMILKTYPNVDPANHALEILNDVNSQS